MKGIYLDYNAAAPTRPEAREAALAALEAGGNASSVHAAGRAVRSNIEEARRHVADLVQADGQDLIFTSGGSEANCLAVQSAVAAGARRLIIGSVEHPCVLEAAEASGLPVELVPVSPEGVYLTDWLADRLSSWTEADGRPFVALMAVNHETGVIQPVAAAASLVRQRSGWMHIDAVAAAGRIGLSLKESGAHTLALSGHKIGGGPGSGALLFADGARLKRQLHGGGQERGLRAGTENAPGIAAFGAAAVCLTRAGGFSKEVERAKEAAAQRLVAQGAVQIGLGAERAPGVLCLATPGFPAHLQVMALDLAGVMVSAGAACSSGRVARSPVLSAMGLGDLADCAIRVSAGWATLPEDWNGFAEAWSAARERYAGRRRLKEVA